MKVQQRALGWMGWSRWQETSVAGASRRTPRSLGHYTGFSTTLTHSPYMSPKQVVLPVLLAILWRLGLGKPARAFEVVGGIA